MENHIRTKNRVDSNRSPTQPQQPCSPPRRASSPVFSSPPPATGKERRNPSVTPRRFRKFFTPTTRSMRGRRILSDIDEASLNRLPVTPRSTVGHDDIPSSDPPYPPASQESACGNLQRRKRSSEQMAHDIDDQEQYGHVPTSPLGATSTLSNATVHGMLSESPQLTTPGPGFQLQAVDPAQLEDWRKTTLSQFFRASRGQSKPSKDEIALGTLENKIQKRVKQKIREHYEPVPIRKFANRGFGAQLLDREHGFSNLAGHRSLTYPAFDPRVDTAAFYSSREDWYNNAANPSRPTPFCLASSKLSPITVLGDESGHLRFLDIDSDRPQEDKLRGIMSVHNNAIMDVAFSEDETRLVTASGDRTCKIIDVATQTIAMSLQGEHESLIRQASFQPGQSRGNVLATSDGHGKIVIWDLRCGQMPAQTFSVRDGTTKQFTAWRNTRNPVVNGAATNVMRNAHWQAYDKRQTTTSLTSIQWLPAGREHLILTGSAASAAVKLWDARYIRPRRSTAKHCAPVSEARPPSHHTFRDYGLTSIALSTDASRFYTVCRDNTIYAYSTAHLMLGEAPELSPNADKRFPRGVRGLGPLYGLKHENLEVRSFYIKARIRAPSNRGSPELMAVGSTGGWPVLIPTDERYLRTAWGQRNHIPRQDSTAGAAPSYSRALNTPMTLTPSNCDIPIYQCGTTLAHGHTKEVSNVSWTRAGRLVTASDDGYVRHWQEDAAKARHLRKVGDFGGERWMAGWALADPEWDANDDDDDDDEI